MQLYFSNLNIFALPFFIYLFNFHKQCLYLIRHYILMFSENIYLKDFKIYTYIFMYIIIT